MLTLEDFIEDQPWTENVQPFSEIAIENQIEGVKIQRLLTHADQRGDLTVLLSSLYTDQRTEHVYLVTARAQSVRAWVYHKHQHDRLAYTNGDIRVVLFDLRKDSPSYQRLNVIDVGSANRVQITIPPFVVHGVQNRGSSDAYFINMPTRAYDPSNPDKSRLPKNHPDIPYVFD